MKIALVGLGGWGSRLVPKLIGHPSVENLVCCDVDSTRSERMIRDFPEVKIAPSYNDILDDPGIHAVTIATPVASHYLLAKQALEHNKHVLVEKPMTHSKDDADRLVDLARDAGLVLMVDHITVYSGAAQSIKRSIDLNALGRLLYFDAVRENLGMIQSDVSVLWDLAVHEFALIDYLLDERPVAVSASGTAFYGALEEIASVTLFFESGISVNVKVSWLAPVKRRELVIAGTKRMLVFNDLMIDEKIRLYDRGVDMVNNTGQEARIEYRDQGSQVLEYERNEPLVAVFDEFIRAVMEDREPRTGGKAGARCVGILAAAEASIKQRGTCIRLHQ